MAYERHSDHLSVRHIPQRHIAFVIAGAKDLSVRTQGENVNAGARLHWRTDSLAGPPIPLDNFTRVARGQKAIPVRGEDEVAHELRIGYQRLGVRLLFLQIP